MDILAKAYNEDSKSNTPKLGINREDSTEKSPPYFGAAYQYRRTDSLQAGSASDKTSKQSKKRPSSGSAKDSDSDSSDSEDDDSASDSNMKDPKGAASHKSSGSSIISTASSSPSVSERSDSSKKSNKDRDVSAGKDRKASSSSKMSSRRSRSRSCLKDRRSKSRSKDRRSRSRSNDRRHRRSSDKHRRSKSRDRRHKSSRSERRPVRRSRSGSRSRDRHSRHHSSRDHRHRGGHRRRHSSSRRHRRRSRSSPSRRHHRRHSRSPDHKRSHQHSEKKRSRSRSPHPSTSSKTENSAVTVTSTLANPGSGRPPVYRASGVKPSRGRGTNNNPNFKDALKDQFKERALQIEQAVSVVTGNNDSAMTSTMTRTIPPLMGTSVATTSAGTAVRGCGGLDQMIANQMMMQRQQQQQQYIPGQPGVLTPAQKAFNQQLLLQTLGQNKEQIEKKYGVTIASMYNPGTNNLEEIAQREKKKELLWKSSDKNKMEGSSAFKAVPVLPGQSKSENQKFARLMGCRKGTPKEEVKEDKSEATDLSPEAQTILKEAEERNLMLQMQYENSRMQTHVARGMGFGYSGTMYQPAPH